ncbi:unnamed protein product [Rotaria socialis]
MMKWIKSFNSRCALAMEDPSNTSMSQRISELDTILENRVIDLEHFTKVHANGDMEINYYEEMLNNKAEQMKNSLFNDIESLQQNIRAYRPQNSDSTETRRNYAQLVENSTNALKFTTSKISHIFSRILQVIKDICNAISENVPKIIDFISSIFSKFIYPLLR